MRFTNGYWKIKDNIIAEYATEYYGHRMEGGRLTLYAPFRHVAGRGNTLDQGQLTVILSAPMEGVVRVDVVNHRGKRHRGPDFALAQPGGFVPALREEEDFLYYEAGAVTARVDRRANHWGIAFLDSATGRPMTDTGFRNMAHMIDRETGKAYMTEQLSVGIGGYVYGLGERFGPFVKNGQTVEIWNEDGGTLSEQAYKNIPFYLTNKGYGVLVNNPGDVSFEITNENVERVRFTAQGEELSYFVIGGPSPDKILERYTALSGRPALPPAWSFGLWLSTSFTTDYGEETTSSFIQGMADRDIPLRVFHFDCFWMKGFQWCDFEWDKDAFPDPEGMLKRYHDRGLKICVWINPYIAQKSRLFDEGMEKGYLLKTRDGDVWQTDWWQAGMGLVDFTNPEATRWYQGKLKALLDMGVDCFKTDFGERIPVREVAYFDGSDPVKMHNFYAYLYNKAVFDLLVEERGEGEACLFARSAAAGGQAFPVHWGGDCAATYESMAESLRGGLSLALCGFGFWSHDISGFEATATPDLYKRWAQFGLLSTHSRLHGSQTYRVPWNFDEEASLVVSRFTKLKCRLMPYLFAMAVKAHKTGLPMMRPMVLSFPEDRACHPLDAQYMLGDHLLVAPIFNDRGECEYYLPKGSWTNLLTGETLEGGRFVTGVFDYFSLPLLAGPDAVIPMGNIDSRPDYDYGDGITFALYHIGDGAEIDTPVYSQAGELLFTAHTSRQGNVITVTADGGKGNWTVQCEGQVVKAEGNRALVEV